MLFIDLQALTSDLATLLPLGFQVSQIAYRPYNYYF